MRTRLALCLLIGHAVACDSSSDPKSAPAKAGAEGKASGANGKDAVQPEAEDGAKGDSPNGDAAGDAKTDTKDDAETDAKDDTKGDTKDDAKDDTKDEPVADPEAPDPGTPAEPAKAELSADLDTTVEIDGGVTLKVAAQSESPKSTLWVERTAKGKPPERFTLRTTTGEVEDLAAVWDGTTLWLAWRSSVPSKTGGRDRALVASAGYDAKLASVGKAKILRSFVPGGELPEDSIEMAARADGGATVAAVTGTERCFSDIEEAMTSCSRMQVDVLASNGDVVRTETTSFDGGDARVDSVIDAETGVAVSFHAYRGGPLTEVMFAPYDPAAPKVNLAACMYPSVTLAFAMDTIVSTCPDPASDNPEMLGDGCKAELGASCGLIGLSDRSGKAFAPSTSRNPEVPLTGIKAVCDKGKSQLELSWAKDGKRPAGSIRVPSRNPCK